MAVIAAGLGTGTISVASFSQGSSITTKSFIPQHRRNCNAVAWNPFHQNQIAAGLDKVRSDCSLFIWDVEQSESVAPKAPSGIPLSRPAPVTNPDFGKRSRLDSKKLVFHTFSVSLTFDFLTASPPSDGPRKRRRKTLAQIPSSC